ncbi:MAG TPA: HD domain-containing phosphohydrolase, partial [Burkholderiaceae bacterium]
MDDARVAAAVAPADDAPYLKSITACGDSRPLVVSQPIYSATGIKLLDTGAKIDSRIFERLFSHSLAEPIDRCVTSSEAVRHRDLVEATRALVAAAPLLAHFDAGLGAQSARVWSALGTCPLPPPIAMRLTVVRDGTPALYEHSLRAAFIALFIGVRARFSEPDLELLATAALLHDIGMMHADPALYEGEKPLDLAARRSLYAHPMTAQLIAQREPLVNPAIATAIAQHHERLDGTGYPRGLAGDAITRLARVLMLVEVVSAVVEHQFEQPELQLSLILRLNHRSFDPGLCDAVLGALPSLALEEGRMPCDRSEYELVTALIDAWQHARAGARPAADDAADFIDARIHRLRRWLAD